MPDYLESASQLWPMHVLQAPSPIFQEPLFFSRWKFSVRGIEGSDYINPVAHTSDKAPDFSARIREGHP